MSKPFFLITIDTEGDNLWRNREVSTQNAAYLERFQALCERFGFKPTYLTNYEMACEPVFQQFGRAVIQRGAAEIGTHLHAWNSPPLVALTDDDAAHKTYLIEYPDELMRAKFDYLHKLLEDTFGTPMRSHRSGRWAFDQRYAALLAEYGYQVDCSVTPYVDWRSTKGRPDGPGGTDYRHFPIHAYFMDLQQIDRPGDSSLLQVPMSTRLKHAAWVNALKQTADRLRGKPPRAPSVQWLRSKRNNLEQMQQTAAKCLAEPGADYVEYMLHSSEFMPGGSPTFDTEIRIESLYQELEQFFVWIAGRCQGATLSDYYQVKLAERQT